MSKFFLCETFRQDIVNSRGIIADTMKVLLYNHATELFEGLDFDQDDIFLEPLLFAYFNHGHRDPCVTLEQLLFGYLDQRTRPARIPVMSDGNGVVYLPQIGYFKTGVQNAHLDLVCQNGAFRLEKRYKNIPYTFEERLMVADGKLEVYRYNHPLFSPYYYLYDPWAKQLPPVEVEVEDTVKRHLPALIKAFAILKQYCPLFYDEILATNRSITLFHNPAVYCFVTMCIHGAIFLTTLPENDEVFFLEELMHQCSHNTFNTLLFSKTDYFNIDVEREMLGEHLNKANETRTIYSALHGLYTVVKRYEGFNVLYHEDLFSGRQKHEFLGRIGDIRKRLNTGLDGLDFDKVYTPKGREVYELLKGVGDNMAGRLRAIDGVFDFSNQPGEFSYAKFSERNPLAQFWPIASHFPV
jgi:hypothetical protein